MASITLFIHAIRESMSTFCNTTAPDSLQRPARLSAFRSRGPEAEGLTERARGTFAQPHQRTHERLSAPQTVARVVCDTRDATGNTRLLLQYCSLLPCQAVHVYDCSCTVQLYLTYWVFTSP